MSRGLVATLSNLPLEQHQAPSPEFMRAILSVYATFFFVYMLVAAFYFVSSLVADFVIPSLALEDTTLQEALRRLGNLIRHETGQVCFYALLKVALFLAGTIAAGLVFYIALFAVVLVVVVVGGTVGFVLHLLHVPTPVLTGLALVVGLPIYTATMIYGTVLTNGTVHVFLESFALFFLGGRYPALGELLDRSTPTPPLPPPGYGGPMPPTARNVALYTPPQT